MLKNTVSDPIADQEIAFRLNRVPAATDYIFDAVLDKANSLRLPFLPRKRLLWAVPLSR